MQYLMIVITLLASACQLIEDPAQQVKGAYASGDIVFDAEDIASTAIKQCQDTDCRNKNLVKYTLHQVALGSKEDVKVLHFGDLLVSYQTNKTYTCLAPTAPLGKLTLLWSKSKTELCYAQDKDKDYVRQFVVACLAEVDWQLVAKPAAANLKQFVCQQGQNAIAASCFVVGNNDICSANTWPDSIKTIYAQVGTTSAQLPPAAENKITGETKLADVKIMAEWKLYGGYGGRIVECSGIQDKTKTFMGTSSKSDVSSNYHEDGTIEEFLTSFGCQKIKDARAIPVTDYRSPVMGICVATSIHDWQEGLENCTQQAEYIKITFEVK